MAINPEIAIEAALAMPRTELAHAHGLLLLSHGWGYDACPDAECSLCAIVACPHREPLHFHHDGCPACYLAGEPEPNPDGCVCTCDVCAEFPCTAYFVCQAH
jgi:hypothetical protein